MHPDDAAKIDVFIEKLSELKEMKEPFEVVTWIVCFN